MAKIDEMLSSVVSGIEGATLSCGTTHVADNLMEQYHVRRRQSDVDNHLLWFIQVDAPSLPSPQVFWAYKFSDCIKKGLAWRNLPIKNSRGPKKA